MPPAPRRARAAVLATRQHDAGRDGDAHDQQERDDDAAHRCMVPTRLVVPGSLSKIGRGARRPRIVLRSGVCARSSRQPQTSGDPDPAQEDASCSGVRSVSGSGASQGRRPALEQATSLPIEPADAPTRSENPEHPRPALRQPPQRGAVTAASASSASSSPGKRLFEVVAAERDVTQGPGRARAGDALRLAGASGGRSRSIPASRGSSLERPARLLATCQRGTGRSSGAPGRPAPAGRSPGRCRRCSDDGSPLPLALLLSSCTISP